MLMRVWLQNFRLYGMRMELRNFGRKGQFFISRPGLSVHWDSRSVVNPAQSFYVLTTRCGHGKLSTSGEILSYQDKTFSGTLYTQTLRTWRKASTLCFISCCSKTHGMTPRVCFSQFWTIATTTQCGKPMLEPTQAHYSNRKSSKPWIWQFDANQRLPQFSVYCCMATMKLTGEWLLHAEMVWTSKSSWTTWWFEERMDFQRTPQLMLRLMTAPCSNYVRANPQGKYWILCNSSQIWRWKYVVIEFFSFVNSALCCHRVRLFRANQWWNGIPPHWQPLNARWIGHLRHRLPFISSLMAHRVTQRDAGKVLQP